MRSVKHCNALMNAFKKIEIEKQAIKTPKPGYGYAPKAAMTATTGFTLSNEYGHIPGLRGPTFDKRGSVSPPPSSRSPASADK